MNLTIKHYRQHKKKDSSPSKSCFHLIESDTAMVAKNDLLLDSVDQHSLQTYNKWNTNPTIKDYNLRTNVKSAISVIDLKNIETKSSVKQKSASKLSRKSIKSAGSQTTTSNRYKNKVNLARTTIIQFKHTKSSVDLQKYSSTPCLSREPSRPQTKSYRKLTSTKCQVSKQAQDMTKVVIPEMKPVNNNQYIVSALKRRHKKCARSKLGRQYFNKSELNFFQQVNSFSLRQEMHKIIVLLNKESKFHKMPQFK